MYMVSSIEDRESVVRARPPTEPWKGDDPYRQ
jgi:hypothetical protein